MKIRGNTLLRSLDRILGPCLLAILRVLPLARHSTPGKNSILIITNSAMGDAVLSSGPLREAMHQRSDADWYIAASDLVHEVLRLAGLQYTALPLEYDKIPRTIRSLRAVRASTVVDIGQWSRISAILARVSGAAIRIGFVRPNQGRALAFNTRVAHKNDRHELDNFSALFSRLLPDGAPAIGPDAARPLIAAHWHKPETHDETTPNGDWIVLHLFPGGTKYWMKEWPAIQSSSCIKAVISAGYQVVLTGGQADYQRARELCPAKSPVCINACGASLAKTASLIAGARAVISVNTGIMHLTAAIGTPLLAIHGPTDPLRWGPLGRPDSIRIISPAQGCRACLDLGGEYRCRTGGGPPSCMLSVTASQVLDALATFGLKTTAKT